MTKAWLEADFQSEQVDMEGEKLVFCRTESIKSGNRGSEASGPSARTPRSLYGWLEGTVRVAPGVDLTEPADPDWGKRIYE